MKAKIELSEFELKNLITEYMDRTLDKSFTVDSVSFKVSRGQFDEDIVTASITVELPKSGK